MKRHRGFTLTEVVVTGVVLAAMLVVCLKLLSATAAQRRSMADRRTANREAANVMERLAARPWEELTAAGAEKIALSAAAERTLLDAELEVEVSEPAEVPGAKRIVVAVRWRDRANQPRMTARLVAFKFRHEEGQ